jgi:hypothetical protein
MKHQYDTKNFSPTNLTPQPKVKIVSVILVARNDSCEKELTLSPLLRLR